MKQIIKKMTLEKFILKFISCWLLTVSVTGILNGSSFNKVEYFKTISLTTFGVVLALFLFIAFILTRLQKSIISDKIITFASFCFYFFCTILTEDNIFYFVVMAGILFGLTVYTFGDLPIKCPSQISIKSYDKYTKAFVGVCFAFVAIFLGVTISFKYLTYSSPAFDFAIFAQMYDNMRESFLPMSTCERDKLLSHFAVHISPIFYLILPIYWIFPSPVTLMVCQALILASGLIPIYLLCKKYKLSNFITMMISATYAFYPALSGGCFYDFHENKFLTPLILWLMYFIEKNKTWGIFTFALLTCMVKEDAPVYIAFIALFVIFGKKNYKKGIGLFLLSIIYFVTALWLLKTFGEGAMVNRYNNYGNADTGLLGVIKAVLVNPAYVISQCMAEEKIKFIMQMLVPLAFIPLINKKFSSYILLGPFILINLMSNYVYQYSIDFQYTYGVIALLFYLFISNISQMNGKWKRIIAIFAVVATIMMFSNTILIKSNYVNKYINNKNNIEIMNEVVDNIPKDSSVAASAFITAHFFENDELYRFPSKNKTDYVVIDFRYGFVEDEKNAFNKIIYGDEYELVEYHKDLIGVYKAR